MNKKRLLLIDGNSLMYKAFHGTFTQIYDLKPMPVFDGDGKPVYGENGKQKIKPTKVLKEVKESPGFNRNGEPVNALRAFSSMMILLRDNFSNYNILVAFDERDLKTYRNKFSFYKQNRGKTPEELNFQRPLIFKFLDLFGIKQYSNKCFEADDIIGTLAKKHSKDGVQVDIVTGDKDLLQLVDESINVYISKTGVSEMERYDATNFKEKFNGLSPKQIIDFKGIVGDTSDNLPGIKGIGEKGAVKLLDEYKTLEEVISNKEKISPALSKKINEHEEMAILCKEIATIIIDGDINISFEQMKPELPNKEELKDFLNSNSVFKILERINQKW